MATLKISDLSVGDWVQDKNGIYAKVIGIENWSNGYFLNIELHGVNVGVTPLASVHPIPITAEILKKNGFEEDNNGHYALKIGGIVAVDIEYTGGIWELSILDVYALQYAGKMQVTIAFVSSIHNLQHALRLAGLDKEINL